MKQLSPRPRTPGLWGGFKAMPGGIKCLGYGRKYLIFVGLLRQVKLTLSYEGVRYGCLESISD